MAQPASGLVRLLSARIASASPLSPANGVILPGSCTSPHRAPWTVCWELSIGPARLCPAAALPEQQDAATACHGVSKGIDKPSSLLTPTLRERSKLAGAEFWFGRQCYLRRQLWPMSGQPKGPLCRVGCGARGDSGPGLRAQPSATWQ